MSMQDHQIVITAIGAHDSGIIRALSQLCRQQKCDIKDMRTNTLANECAMYMLISGSWHSIAKIEANLPKLSRKYDILFQTKRSEETSDTFQAIPYTIQVLAADRIGIVFDIADFIEKQAIVIDDLTTETFVAKRSKTPMFGINMTVRIPNDIHLPSLREKFLIYCEDKSIDAILEMQRY